MITTFVPVIPPQVIGSTSSAANLGSNIEPLSDDLRGGSQ